MEEVMRLLRRWFDSTPSLHVEQLIIPILIDSYYFKNISTLFYVWWRVLAVATKFTWITWRNDQRVRRDQRYKLLFTIIIERRNFTVRIVANDAQYIFSQHLLPSSWGWKCVTCTLYRRLCYKNRRKSLGVADQGKPQHSAGRIWTHEV